MGYSVPQNQALQAGFPPGWVISVEQNQHEMTYIAMARERKGGRYVAMRASEPDIALMLLADELKRIGNEKHKPASNEKLK